MGIRKVRPPNGGAGNNPLGSKALKLARLVHHPEVALVEANRQFNPIGLVARSQENEGRVPIHRAAHKGLRDLRFVLEDSSRVGRGWPVSTG
jgi:hypothetical protein